MLTAQERDVLQQGKGVCQEGGLEEYLPADSAEEKSCGDYRALGLPCRGAEKGPGSVKAGMKWLQSLAEIRIDPARCPDTAKEFSEYEYEKDKKTRFMSTGIPVRSLPDELVQELLNFKYVSSEAQLYDFLESYSS